MTHRERERERGLKSETKQHTHTHTHKPTDPWKARIKPSEKSATGIEKPCHYSHSMRLTSQKVNLWLQRSSSSLRVTW